MEPRPKNRLLPISEWPQADREAWLRALEPVDLLDPAIGQANRWSEATRKMIVSGYGRWLSHLLRIGELHSQEHPGARATRERVSSYRAAMRAANLADYTISLALQQLGNALKVMSADEDFSWISRAAWRLHASAEPARDLRSRLRAADELIELGLALMKAAEEGEFARSAEQACLYRDGLVIAFLMRRPIRSRSLQGLRLEDHVRKRGAGWWVCLEGAIVKSGRPLEFSWPTALSKHLDRYLEVYRPALLAASQRGAMPGKALWISAQGTQMTSEALSTQVKNRTGRAFGEPINLHSFRYMAATTIATLDPENAAYIAAILDHSSLGASDKYYNRARSVDAGRRYGAALTEARKSRKSKGR